MTLSFTLRLTLLVLSATTSLALNALGAPNRIIVSPSVAKANFLNLGADLASAIDGGAEWLHFSVQDGRMVPKISFGAPVVAACRDAFPNTVFDVKLGCIEPEARVNDFVKAGADIISVHPEATLQLGAVINKIADFGVAPGVILNPGTSVTSVEHVLDQCSVAVVMLVSWRVCFYKSWFSFLSHHRCIYSLGQSRIWRAQVYETSCHQN
jgi:ribulose-phosphate 3-epimerase